MAAMAHDTGSTNISIFEDEVIQLTHTPLLVLLQISMVTAAGNVPARNVAVYMRVVTEDGQRVIVDWHLETALVSHLMPCVYRLPH